MPETVPIPQGATFAPVESAPSGGVPIPQGATIQSDDSTETGQTPPAEAQDPRAGIGKGVLQGLGQTVGTVSGLINKIPGIGETLAPKQGVTALESMSTPQTLPEKVGAGAEGLLEFMAGDEALKGLTLAARLKMATSVAEMAESHPFLSKLIKAGLSSLRYGTTPEGEKLLGTAARTGTVGTGEALLKGASPEDALKQGAVTGAAGLVAGGLLPEAGTAAKGTEDTLGEGAGVPPKAIDRTVAAANPKVGGGRFMKSVEKALPDMQRVAHAGDAAPKDLVGYIDLAKKTGENLESQFQQIMEPVKGAKVDTTPIADAMESRITPYIEKKYPDLAESIRKEAEVYRGQQMSLEELDDFRKGVNNENDTYFKKNNLARSDALKDVNVGYKVAEGDAIHDLQYDTLNKLTGEDVRELKKTQSAVREVRENLQNNYNRLALKDAKFRGSTNIEQLYNIFNKGISSHPVQGVRELYGVLAGKSPETIAANTAAKTALSGSAIERTGATAKEAAQGVRATLTPKTLAATVSATQTAQGKPNAKADLEKALDSYDKDDPDKEKAQDDIYQKIIQFRKAAKNMPEEERDKMNKRIAEYSNQLVAR